MKRRDPAKLSQEYASYLEKHRIFELFQELSAMLLIKKPDDHVLFLKQSIHHAARRLDVPRVIIMAPPSFNRKQLGEILASKLMIPLIRLKDFTDDCEPYLPDSTFVTEKLRMILMNYMKFNCDGWIFLDFPRNDREARHLQRVGLIPSHVIDITLEEVNNKSSDSEYFKEIRGLRRVFANLIKRINAKDKQFEEVLDSCLGILKQRMYKNIGAKLRIVLIDSQDSNRCESLGKHIAQEFGVNHIKYSEIIECITSQCSELGDDVRVARENTDSDRLSSLLKVQCFKQFLRQPKYENMGWILTGFPRCVGDLKQLDMTELRPNRIIIVVGKNYGTDEISYIKCPDLTAETITGPDHVCMCDNDIEDILKYCGGSAFVIREEDKCEDLKNKIDFYLAQPPPCVPPREPKPPRIVKPEEIEFDPDDEPSPDVFDEIREPEPTLQLV